MATRKAQPEGREIAELLTMRREAHLDLDSFLSRT